MWRCLLSFFAPYHGVFYCAMSCDIVMRSLLKRYFLKIFQNKFSKVLENRKKCVYLHPIWEQIIYGGCSSVG